MNLDYFSLDSCVKAVPLKWGSLLFSLQKYVNCFKIYHSFTIFLRLGAIKTQKHGAVVVFVTFAPCFLFICLWYYFINSSIFFASASPSSPLETILPSVSMMSMVGMNSTP